MNERSSEGGVLATLDLNLLRVLDALFEERSVTGAARRLRITQPALSNALARLRTAVDDPLFVRAGRGVVPTARALSLETPVRGALRQLEDAFTAERFDPQSSRRVFRVMTSDALELVLMPAVLRRLAAEAPGVDLVLAPPPVRADGVRAALEQDEVDLTCGVAVEDGSGVQGASLGTDGYLCLVRKGHPLTHGPLTVERYASCAHVLVAPRGGRTGVVDAALAELNLSRRIHVRTTHFASAPGLLVGSDLVLTLSARAARHLARLWSLTVLRPPLALPSVPLGLRWHERYARDPGHRFLRRVLAEEGRALPDA